MQLRSSYHREPTTCASVFLPIMAAPVIPLNWLQSLITPWQSLDLPVLPVPLHRCFSAIVPRLLRAVSTTGNGALVMELCLQLPITTPLTTVILLLETLSVPSR